jgi:hypothetical protein
MTRTDLDPGHPTDDPLTDQHGRPLDLLYGFVSRGTVAHEVDEADLRSAEDEALDAYRRFLADENGSGVQTSNAFTLRSRTGHATGPVRPAPRTVRVETAGRPHARLWAALIGVPATAVAVVAALLWLRPGIDVPAAAGCRLDAASRSCTIQVTVRSSGLGGLSYAGASIDQPPDRTGTGLWTLDDAGCRSAAEATTCPITVTATVPVGAVGQRLTATLTVKLSDPGRTGTVALTATG